MARPKKTTDGVTSYTVKALHTIYRKPGDEVLTHLPGSEFVITEQSEFDELLALSAIAVIDAPSEEVVEDTVEAGAKGDSGDI